MQALEPQAGETLERMLARYARVRLDPSPAQARRARAAVMEEAWRRRFELAAGSAAVPATAPDTSIGPVARPRRLPFARWGARRLSGAASAAVLAGLLLGTTAFATSRAGGPFYETRLALEELTLPSDPASHVEAEIAMAQTRLAEIVEASSRGDERAMTAALAAYEREIDTLGATTGEPSARALEAVASHRAVLERVAGMVPAQARGGLERALAAGDTVIQRLSAAGAPGSNGAGNGGAPNGNGAGNGGAPGSNGAGNGGAPNGNGAGNGGAPGSNGAGNGGAPNGNGAGNGNGNGAGNGNGNGNGNARQREWSRRIRLAGSQPDRQARADAAPEAHEGARRPRQQEGRHRFAQYGEALSGRPPRRYPPPSKEEHGMRLTVLGAGPAYTDRAGATGACYLVSEDATHLLLDLGQGSFTRVFPHVAPTDLAAVVVSHLHPDHFIDLVAMRHYLRYEFDPPRRVRVLGPGALADRLDALHAEPGFTAEALDVERLDEAVRRIGALSLEARLVAHTDESYGIRVAGDDGPGTRVQRRLRSRGRPGAAGPAGGHAPRRGLVRGRARPARRAPPGRAGGRTARGIDRCRTGAPHAPPWRPRPVGRGRLGADPVRRAGGDGLAGEPDRALSRPDEGRPGRGVRTPAGSLLGDSDD